MYIIIKISLIIINSLTKIIIQKIHKFSEMLKKIKSKFLSTFISNIGPYVVFCNAYQKGQNAELVKYMYTIEEKLKHIVFIELGWEEYKKFKNSHSDYYMNSIYAYYKNSLLFYETLPNSENLFLFFRKVIELYNEKIDTKISHVGSKIEYNIFKNNLPLKFSFEKDLRKQKDKYIRHKKCDLLRKKIKLSVLELKQFFYEYNDNMESQNTKLNKLTVDHWENNILNIKNNKKQTDNFKDLFKNCTMNNSNKITHIAENKILNNTNNEFKINIDDLSKSSVSETLKKDNNIYKINQRISKNHKNKIFVEVETNKIEKIKTNMYTSKSKKLSLHRNLSKYLLKKYKNHESEHPLIKNIKRKYSYIKFPYYNKTIIQ